MLKLVVTNNTPAKRTELLEKIMRSCACDQGGLVILPNVSVSSLAPEELKFNAAPDICIVGEELAREDLRTLSEIRRTVPGSALIVHLDGINDDLEFVERLASYGADDVLCGHSAEHDLRKKIILLSRKVRKSRAGKTVVFDGGKGGAGVTSIAAACGDLLARRGKRVVLVDFDMESQDLSRFLSARPFVNENLQDLIDGRRAINLDSIRECCTQVWANEQNLFCMSPPIDGESLYAGRISTIKALMTSLEYLEHSFELVLIDAGSLVGLVRRTLYRAADRVALVIGNDAAGLYASLERARKILKNVQDRGALTVLKNDNAAAEFPLDVLRADFNRLCGIGDENWSLAAIPYDRRAGGWPGSGETLYAPGRSGIGHALEQFVAGLFPEAGRSHPTPRVRSAGLLRKFGARLRGKAAETPPGVAPDLPATRKPDALQPPPKRAAIAWENFDPAAFLGKAESGAGAATAQSEVEES